MSICVVVVVGRSFDEPVASHNTRTMKNHRSRRRCRGVRTIATRRDGACILLKVVKGPCKYVSKNLRTVVNDLCINGLCAERAAIIHTHNQGRGEGLN